MISAFPFHLVASFQCHNLLRMRKHSLFIGFPPFCWHCGHPLRLRILSFSSVWQLLAEHNIFSARKIVKVSHGDIPAASLLTAAADSLSLSHNIVQENVSNLEFGVKVLL
jgi:hypothetical protein